MFQRCAIVAVLVFIAFQLATAQDAIPPDTVVAVKKATVFVKVDWGLAKGTGTGFVVEVQKDAVLIATNYHVVAYPSTTRGRASLPPSSRGPSKLTNVSVVFDSGTKTEVASKAEVVAADIDNDLAILRVVGLKNKPTPIDYRSASTPVETMPVYMFGFPLGQSLSTTKGNPAVTVGKGSVSSIRTDEKGELVYVQIDGAINPGNSGGPVVDVKGQVVGVAVATYRDAQGIGLAVPGVDLVRLMKGRICGLHAVVGRTPTNKTSVKAEVEVSDPLGAVREVTLHYLVLPRGAKWPDDPIEKQTGEKKTTLKVAGAVAAGEIVLDSADGVVLVRAVPVGGAGAEGASPLRAVDLRGGILPGPGARKSGIGGETFPGWKEFTPKDRTYTVWIPEQPTSQSDQERSMSIRGQSVKINSMNFQVPEGGPACRIDQAILEGSLADENPAELQTSIRDTIVRDVKGRVISEENTLVGSVAAKEYRISTGTGVVRGGSWWPATGSSCCMSSGHGRWWNRLEHRSFWIRSAHQLDRPAALLRSSPRSGGRKSRAGSTIRSSSIKHPKADSSWAWKSPRGNTRAGTRCCLPPGRFTVSANGNTPANGTVSGTERITHAWWRGPATRLARSR